MRICTGALCRLVQKSNVSEAFFVYGSEVRCARYKDITQRQPGAVLMPRSTACTRPDLDALCHNTNISPSRRPLVAVICWHILTTHCQHRTAREKHRVLRQQDPKPAMEPFVGLLAVRPMTSSRKTTCTLCVKQPWLAT